ncbi:hypothetical protein [Jeongeupia chitinilytica]|uniref:Fimbrial assembly protein n=1 Tax=Jeongeupia chitinilytica TaxID=1041641 RepID=A0ABQ3H1Y8_9NEIS|nr:hypothetical protein [Jeongeupia chitinilytica]GHD61727.1 hypothetical protein GCM10007350_16520 [Jeongeupia chitinilytica]
MSLPLRQDWPLLRGAVSWLVFATGVGAGLCYAAWQYRTSAEAGFETGHDQLQAMQARVDDARTQLDQLGELQREYTRLRVRGAIGAEHRLEWVEYLNAGARRWPGLGFQLAARRPVSGGGEQDGLQLFASRMNVHFIARDETDWSDFNAGLRRLPGWPAEGSCRIARSAAEDRAGLAVDCDYEWLSIDRAATGGTE